MRLLNQLRGKCIDTAFTVKGFEPWPPKRMVPKTIDHSTKQPYVYNVQRT